jgi:hypothetical protein
MQIILVGIHFPNPERYARGTVAVGRAFDARQVKVDDPEEKGYPGPSGWGWAWGCNLAP